MSNHSKGKDYEDFVESVYQAILLAEKREGKTATIQLERNRKIISKSGTPAEIDIYWEYEIAGVTHQVAIECKNYNKSVDIQDVRNFARKIEQMSGLKGLMVSKLGFSGNAVKEASADHIDLLIIREQKDSDWDGYLRHVNINFHALMPTRTITINPAFNKEWMFANGFKVGDTISYQTTNDKILIEDRSEGFSHTLHALESHSFFEEKGVGRHTWSRAFKDGWISFDQQTFKLDSIDIEYANPAPIKSELHIDYSQYVLAIMEYVNRDQQKYAVLKSGERKPYG